jgi:hypothetical protein
VFSFLHRRYICEFLGEALADLHNISFANCCDFLLDAAASRLGKYCFRGCSLWSYVVENL